MELISVKDREIAAYIIDQGYIRAAASFSTLVNQRVQIENLSINTYTNADKVLQEISNEVKSTIILTEIIGDLAGESYLIFSEPEREQICAYCMKAFASGNGNKLEDELILKEVDNILSAAVITEFSNQLQIQVFGDVPKVISKESLFAEHPTAKSKNYFLLSNARFIFEDHLELSPKFLWRLDNHFIDMVKNMGGNQ
ncbi:hypothetical protein QQ008_20635 [Fulvivirgaceae bacterium BMA10]|uniref:Chemotaxis protein CheC n=1 Tax=Splendidivirga corallicola TaxID=3051826 RepID=A0ABT8KST7_9BACT|nr:hypothetical protein [Fulvivirgaceae bacterium BMA10]